MRIYGQPASCPQHKTCIWASSSVQALKCDYQTGDMLDMAFFYYTTDEELKSLTLYRYYADPVGTFGQRGRVMLSHFGATPATSMLAVMCGDTAMQSR